MGNKRIPQELKIVRGTYRADRDPRGDDGAPDTLRVPPRCPRYLGKEGKALWRKLASYLVEVGILLDHHIPLLQICCMEYQGYMDSSMQLASGVPADLEERRELRLLKAGAYQAFRMMLLEFGLTPGTVEKIPKAGPRPEMSEIERIMRDTK